MTRPTQQKTLHIERALLVQVVLPRDSRIMAEDSLEELERLADTAGAQVIGRITQRRDRPTAPFFVGEGKLADIQLACRESKADLIIFDNELTSVQVNNLDQALGFKVIDRTELILQIFARRARSAESQVQVELAQLEYLITRIPASEKQPRFRGGIGMKGPGESPFQLRNEPMRRRIRDLKVKLELIQKRRANMRQRRRLPSVCLVGYTNAGKSTLLNAFSSKGGSYVDDRLFATLDTCTRSVYLAEGRSILLTDTVGFIRHLPHGLVASFRSTLEEASDADLLLLVVDAGHPHVADYLRVVRETLAEVGAGEIPTLLLFNKSDTEAAQAALPTLLQEFPDARPVSAVAGTGISDLKSEILNTLAGKWPDKGISSFDMGEALG